MEKEKTFKILTTEEMNKIEKKQKEALLPKEEVKEIIFENDLYIVKYMQDTYKLQKKFLVYEQPVPFRIPLFQVLRKNNSELLIAIDAIPTFTSYHLHGSIADGKNENIFRSKMNSDMMEDGSYEKCELFIKLNNRFLFSPHMNDRSVIIHSIFETLAKIVSDLSNISMNATYTHKTDYSGTGPLYEEMNANLITDISSPNVFKELEVNICSSKNIIYPLYYKKFISMDPFKNRAVPLKVRHDTKISFFKDEIILAREDKTDVVSRDFIYKKYDSDKLVSEKIIDKDNLDFNPRENIAISVLKQLPTMVIEIALTLKRVFGEGTVLKFADDNSGAAILTDNFSLVIKLNSTVSQRKFCSIELNSGGNYHSLLVDLKDFTDILSNAIKCYIKKESLSSDVEDLSNYILGHLNYDNENYDFLYTADDLDPNLEYDYWYEEEDMTQEDKVIENLDSEIHRAIKFKKWNNGFDDLVYFMNFNKNNELFVIINKVDNRNFFTTEYGRAINEVDENLHGNLVSFRICLDGDTVVFLPIRNKLNVSYSLHDTSRLYNMDNETLNSLISPIADDSIFMELIQNYIKLNKDLGNDGYFEIQK